MTKDQTIALATQRDYYEQACKRLTAELDALKKPTPDCRNVTPAEDVLLRNATLQAGKKIEKPDCRTCWHLHTSDYGDDQYECDSIETCTNGNQYQLAPAVVLWRTKP